MANSSDLPLPYDLKARYGEGLTHAVVLGGGGLFFVAWQVTYLHELHKRGVRLQDTPLVVGTSAGSIVAALLAADRLQWARTQFALLRKLPAFVSSLRPTPDLLPSQERALTLFRQARDSRPETVRTIGHAALAAESRPADSLRRTLTALLATRGWPSDALAITTVDTFTAERLVVRSAAGVSAARAAAASSSVPGLFAPQPVGDRKCMDGGVSGSGTHADLAVGASRVLLLSLSAHVQSPEPMMTIAPDSLPREVAAIKDAGGRVFVRGPHTVNLADLMSPHAIPGAIAQATNQARADAEELRTLWSAA